MQLTQSYQNSWIYYLPGREGLKVRRVFNAPGKRSTTPLWCRETNTVRERVVQDRVPVVVVRF